MSDIKDAPLPLPPIARLHECFAIAGKNTDAMAYAEACFKDILKSNRMEGQCTTLLAELTKPPQPDVLQAVEMDITLDKNNQLDRGYLVDGEHPVDNQQVALMDSGFHSWLRKEGMLCRGQIIYAGDAETGEIETDVQGKKVQIEPAVLKSKLLDQVKGLQQHFNSQIKGFELKTLHVEVAGHALDTEDAPQPE